MGGLETERKAFLFFSFFFFHLLGYVSQTVGTFSFTFCWQTPPPASPPSLSLSMSMCYEKMSLCHICIEEARECGGGGGGGGVLGARRSVI